MDSDKVMTSDTDTGSDTHRSDNLGHEFGHGHKIFWEFGYGLGHGLAPGKIFNFGLGFGHGHEIFKDFGHGHGLGQSHDFGRAHDFGHGHVRKSRTRTRTNFGHACPLISVLNILDHGGKIKNCIRITNKI